MADKVRVEVSGINRVQLMNEIDVKIGRDMKTDVRPKRFAEEVRDHWANREAPSPWNPHPLTRTGPYATGAYANSIKVRQMRDAGGRFLASFEVYTLSPIAHFLEYGTKRDKPDSKSPWGPNTPTPEFAPALKTALHFRGTPG